MEPVHGPAVENHGLRVCGSWKPVHSVNTIDVSFTNKIVGKS